MARLEIYGVPPSTYTRVIRMACEEKGVDYDFKMSPPHSPDVDAIHPFGKVPVMRHGDLTLCESKAIASYIDRAFNGKGKLFPDDPRQAAEVEQWVSITNTILDQPMIREYVLGYVTAKDGNVDRKRIDGAVEKMKKQIDVLDEQVADTGYLVGNSFTYADINLMPILAYLKNFPESAELLKPAKNLNTYFDKHSSRPSFAKTAP